MLQFSISDIHITKKHAVYPERERERERERAKVEPMSNIFSVIECVIDYAKFFWLKKDTSIFMENMKKCSRRRENAGI